MIDQKKDIFLNYSIRGIMRQKNSIKYCSTQMHLLRLLCLNINITQEQELLMSKKAQYTINYLKI
jgi:hypothetical protein